MVVSLHGLRFEEPDGFAIDEVTFSLKDEAPRTPKASLTLEKQTSIVSNIIVNRRCLAAGEHPANAEVRVLSELVHAVAHNTAVGDEPITFDDEVQGRIVAYEVEIEGMRLRQYCAVRTDGRTITTITLTVDPTQLTAEKEAGYRKSLSSFTAVANETF